MRVLGKTVWVVAGSCVLVALFAAHRVVAEPLSTFEKLHQLDRAAERHDAASERLVRSIERWDQNLLGAFDKGELAERAVGRLQRKAARRLAGWERLHRHVRRNSHRWPAGTARDLRHLLHRPAIESLGRSKELFATIGQLLSEVQQPSALLGRRVRMTVELAQHRASRDATDAGKQEVIEDAKASEKHAIKKEMQESQKKLEESLERLIEHKTGEDFHRKKGTLVPPVPGKPDVLYGRRKQPNSVTYVRHTGLTYRVEKGTPIRAAATGLVVFAKRFEGYGEMVIIDHGDDYHTLYAHMDGIAVEVGDEIERGDRVGRAGATDSLEGPKVYFELRHREQPVDPMPWFLTIKKEEADGETKESPDAE